MLRAWIVEGFFWCSVLFMKCTLLMVWSCCGSSGVWSFENVEEAELLRGSRCSGFHVVWSFGLPTVFGLLRVSNC